METDPNQTTKPATDLSPRVVQLARMIDNLPPGVYEISLQKQDVRAQDWSVEIVRTEKIPFFAGSLSKKTPPE
jgi:hypothetical protein